MNKIYIILPIYNRRDTTIKFVDCLKAQTYQNYQLLLVDDGSTDGTAEAVQNEIPSVVVIKGQGNWWWAGGLQQGINWFKSNNAIKASDLVLMINDDVIFDEHFLEKAVDLLNNKHNVLLHSTSYGIQTGRLVNAGVKFDYKKMKFKQTIDPKETNCLATMGLFLRFSDLKKIGNFYPRLLPHYLSDYEFTIRAHNKGFKLYAHPELKLWVNEETTGLNYKKMHQLDFKNFIKQYFSKKSSSNPISWTFFYILTSPKIWLPLNMAKIWKRAFKSIFYRFLRTYFFYKNPTN